MLGVLGAWHFLPWMVSTGVGGWLIRHGLLLNQTVSLTFPRVGSVRCLGPHPALAAFPLGSIRATFWMGWRSSAQ